MGFKKMYTLKQLKAIKNADYEIRDAEDYIERTGDAFVPFEFDYKEVFAALTRTGKVRIIIKDKMDDLEEPLVGLPGDVKVAYWKILRPKFEQMGLI